MDSTWGAAQAQCDESLLMTDFLTGIILGYFFGCAVCIVAVRRAEQYLASSQQE
jgi:hypothetical protein